MCVAPYVGTSAVIDRLRYATPALTDADVAELTAELAEIGGLLENHRLVTLVGVGGTGKTRVMLQAAAEFLDRYRDGAWLVELAPVVDPAEAMASYTADRARWDGLLQRNDFQAVALGFHGTPGLAFETTLYTGALDRTAILDAIAAARAA